LRLTPVACRQEGGEMKFYANITLNIDEFDADNEEKAKEIIDSYITSLANTEDESLSWQEMNYEVKEATE